MKTCTDLWSRQEVDSSKLEAIRRDWSEGKVPELPYLVIGQEALKKHISNKIKCIEGPGMTSTVIQAQYGDGKTNVLKYLELYFKKHPELNIRLIYCRANPEQIDLCVFLMQHLEAYFLNDLMAEIKILRKDEDFRIETLVNNFDNDFKLIEEYTRKLFEADLADDQLKSILLLGTGRLYSKAMFTKYGLKHLTDFNRKEIFVLFMNILAQSGRYVIFAIDELEKINDKSIKRMAHYFTSYRELLDLFNKINGHYMISTITNGVNIAASSQPLKERLNKDIVGLSKLSSKEDLNELVQLLVELLEIDIDKQQIQVIAGKLKKADLVNNRTIIQAATEMLNSPVEEKNMSFDEILQSKELDKIYNRTELVLDSQGAFNNLSRGFFDPLEYYLESLGFKVNNKNLLKRDYQAFIDSESTRAYFFLFNDDSKIKSRIEEFVNEKNIYNFVVFTPKNLEVTYSGLQIENVELNIIEYNPKQMFILLNMYRWNLDKQPQINEVLDIITKSIFY